MISLSRSKIRMSWLLLMVALLPVISLLSACGSSDGSTAHEIQMAPLSKMSMEVQSAPLSVREAYQFAVANPDALQNVPCYCGCGAAGHTSNYSCYVKEENASGITFDQHALGCSLCVDITQSVIKMTRNGKSPQEMRAAIDSTYSRYGPPNMLPVQ